MKDSQRAVSMEVTKRKYIKANNERFSTWDATITKL